MANHEINEDQDALTRALRMIETGDPVHADVYNALFSVLINNDVFLEKLANKMIQQAMISHVTDCTNPDMVMGADQGPVFTQLIEKVKEQVDVLNTKSQITLLKAGIYVSNSITLQEIYDCKKSGRIIIENQSKLAPSYGSGILLYSSSTSFKVLMADDDSGSLYFWFCSNRKASDKMVDAVSVVKII